MSAPGPLPEGFSLHPFAALSPQLLYRILALRQEVFVVEQHCVFLDADGRDLTALHLVHHAAAGPLDAGEPGAAAPAVDAYARLFLPSGDEPASFGRVLTAPGARGRGLGHRLVAVALHIFAELAPGADVHIAAQAHLDAWYSKHRFERVGAPYLYDGIAHLDMVRRWGSG